MRKSRQGSQTRDWSNACEGVGRHNWRDLNEKLQYISLQAWARKKFNEIGYNIGKCHQITLRLQCKISKSCHYGLLRNRAFYTSQWPKKHFRVAESGFWGDFPQVLGGSLYWKVFSDFRFGDRKCRFRDVAIRAILRKGKTSKKRSHFLSGINRTSYSLKLGLICTKDMLGVLGIKPGKINGQPWNCPWSIL